MKQVLSVDQLEFYVHHQLVKTEVFLNQFMVHYPQAKNKNIANPIATILSAAMMLDFLNLNEESRIIKKAVNISLENKISTADLNKNNPSTTSEVGDYISKKIKDENL